MGSHEKLPRDRRPDLGLGLGLARGWAPAALRALGAALALTACQGKQQQPAGGPDPNRPVPVAAAPVQRRDVPVYLDGLGSVVAYKTVTVRSQVDGRLDKVLFREGQAVKRGEVLAQVDPRPFQVLLQQAEGALARDRALLKSNQLNLERNQTLRKENLIAQQQLDEQQAAVGQYEGAVRIDQAQVDNARLQLDYARIAAPIDGVTGVRLVDEGNVVRQADTGGIVVITQLDPIAVLFTVPQDALPQIAEAREAGTLAVEAYSRDGASKLGAGELSVIDNQINQATSTLRLKAVFPNPERRLWPNQFVKARLLLTVRRGVSTVPAPAVQRGPKGTFAYVISDGKADVRTIEVERVAEDVAIVKSGLSPGEQVVVEGQNQLRPGSKVQTRGAGVGGGKDGKGDGPDGAGKGGSGKDGGGKGGARPDGGSGAPAEAER